MKAIFFNNLFIFLILAYFQKSFQYRTFSIEDDDLCSLVTKRKLKLGKADKSALRVIQKRLNDHPIDWEKNLQCKFEVQSSYFKGGVMAVIQNLNFRKNAFECVDFVQFRAKDGSTSQKYCGNINASVIMNSQHNINSMNHISYENSFIDEKGELDVIIFVSRKVFDYNIKMELDIVFTSYKDCSDPRDSFDLIPCSEEHSKICIEKMFFNDHYINCPYTNCADELSCLHSDTENKIPQSIGNKVIIGSISSLCLMFTIFILCVWTCKRHKIFCWAEDFAHPSPTPEEESNRNSRVIELNEQTGARLAESQRSVIPSAPIEEDKDLPPSYDSLFPETTANR